MSMSPPRAIREDHDPFGFAVVNVITRVVRWTTLHCPHCRHVFKISWGPTLVLLGAGGRNCRACGKLFDDASREWPELDWNEKFAYLFPTSVAGLLAACLVVLALVAYAGLIDRGAVSVGALNALLVLFVAFMFPWSYIDVRASANQHVGIAKCTRGTLTE